MNRFHAYSRIRRHRLLLEQEFERLIDEHSPLIYRVCYTYGSREPETLADLYQETCIALWEQLPRFRHDSNSRTWVYRVAFNTACSYYRQRSKRRTVKLASPELLQALVEVDEGESRHELLYRLIDQLPPDDRMMIQLQLDGNSYEDMAHLLNTSLDGVRGRLRRARDKIRELYRNYRQDE